MLEELYKVNDNYDSKCKCTRFTEYLDYNYAVEILCYYVLIDDNGMEYTIDIDEVYNDV